MSDQLVQYVERKSMKIRPSGRSTDFISPSFGHGCLYNCTYCYMKRHKPEGLTIAENVDTILEAIDKHVMEQPWPKVPNQTDDYYYTYDIGCNEDFALHAKYHDWKKIFSFFLNHPRAKASFATKYVNKAFLGFGASHKIRIRMSLMPSINAMVLEPNTSYIQDRIMFLNQLFISGYDPHVNFSPVVVTKGGLDEYRVMFEGMNTHILENVKPYVKAEVIFLTHNKKKHEYNLENNLPGEDLLWRPELQETKISQYGGENLRYKRRIKGRMIQEFLKVMNETIPWCTVRYAF